MADEHARDILQPALLDRLMDDARTVTRFEISSTVAELAAASVNRAGIVATLRAIGVREWDTDDDPLRDAGAWSLSCFALGRSVRLDEVRAAMVRCTDGPRVVAISSFARVTAAIAANTRRDPTDRRAITGRRLRESVLRDLANLLNCTSLDTSVDLTRYPFVARSVLNYGMPNLAGVARSSADGTRLAARIKAAVEAFEPRLSRVRVIPEGDPDGNEAFSGFAFRIEAELWSDPAPQRLQVRTQIDPGTGATRITDAGS